MICDVLTIGFSFVFGLAVIVEVVHQIASLANTQDFAKDGPLAIMFEAFKVLVQKTVIGCTVIIKAQNKLTTNVSSAVKKLFKRKTKN